MEVIAEVNRARTDPQSYARWLKTQLRTYDGMEGTYALEQAIRILERSGPRRALTYHAGLEAAARDHVEDQAATGRTGHIGSDGSTPFERIRPYVAASRSAENIAYGYWSARAIVMELIIDDGVRGRGHRKNIMEPSFASIGVAVGTHPKYGIMAVMEFAAPGATSKR